MKIKKSLYIRPNIRPCDQENLLAMYPHYCDFETEVINIVNTIVNGGGGGGGSTTFIGLTDTPGAYSAPGQIVAINSTNDGLEFISPSAVGSDGVISNVTLSGSDLVFTGSNGGFNGTVSLSTIPLSFDNIYTVDGSLDSNRTVNLNNNTLNFSGPGDIAVSNAGSVTTNSSSASITTSGTTVVQSTAGAVQIIGNSFTNINGSGQINIIPSVGNTSGNTTIGTQGGGAGNSGELRIITSETLSGGNATAGQVLTLVNPATGQAEWTTVTGGGGGVNTFLQLTDTPVIYGTPGQVATINPAGDGLIFTTPSSPITDTSIYVGDGTLTSNRTVTGNGNSMTFDMSSGGVTNTITQNGSFNQENIVEVDSSYFRINKGTIVASIVQYNAPTDRLNGISFGLTGTTISSSIAGDDNFISVNPDNIAFEFKSTGDLTINGVSGLSGEVLTSNGPDLPPSWEALSSSENIYTNNGTLEENRIINIDGKSISFSDATSLASNFSISNVDSFSTTSRSNISLYSLNDAEFRADTSLILRGQQVLGILSDGLLSVTCGVNGSTTIGTQGGGTTTQSLKIVTPQTKGGGTAINGEFLELINSGTGDVEWGNPKKTSLTNSTTNISFTNGLETVVIRGAAIVTLPTSADVIIGLPYRVKNRHAASITISAPGALNIEGLATVSINAGESATFIYDGIEYNIF